MSTTLDFCHSLHYDHIVENTITSQNPKNQIYHCIFPFHKRALMFPLRLYQKYKAWKIDTKFGRKDRDRSNRVQATEAKGSHL